MNRVDLAASAFQEGCSCSQSILATYGPLHGLDGETALKVARAFGGGMGRMGEVCGAMTGALMVLGLASSNKDPQAKDAVYAAVREFTAQFKARNGSISCRELLGLDLSTPEGVAQFKELRLHETRCTKLVRDAAEILECLTAAKDERRP